MRRLSTPLRLAAVGMLSMSLAGCISLLPKTKPAHLYRFGQAEASEPVDAAPAGSRVGVFRANATFQREAAGDRILTIRDGKVAYIAETRWVAPASVLWDQAVLAAFDQDAGPVRLVARGEPSNAAYVLRLDVRNFETRYDHGRKAAPTVVVRVRAVMTKGADHNLVSDKIFESRVTAGDNRVGAIVGAYDRAVADVLEGVVAWANAEASAT